MVALGLYNPNSPTAEERLYNLRNAFAIKELEGSVGGAWVRLYISPDPDRHPILHWLGGGPTAGCTDAAEKEYGEPRNSPGPIRI